MSSYGSVFVPVLRPALIADAGPLWACLALSVWYLASSSGLTSLLSVTLKYSSAKRYALDIMLRIRSNPTAGYNGAAVNATADVSWVVVMRSGEPFAVVRSGCDVEVFSPTMAEACLWS